MCILYKTKQTSKKFRLCNLPFIKTPQALLRENSNSTSYKPLIITVFENILAAMFWAQFILKLHANLDDIYGVCYCKINEAKDFNSEQPCTSDPRLCFYRLLMHRTLPNPHTVAVKLLTAPAKNSTSILTFKFLNAWAFKFSYVWRGSMWTKRLNARIFHWSKIRPVPRERSLRELTEQSSWHSCRLQPWPV